MNLVDADTVGSMWIRLAKMTQVGLVPRRLLSMDRERVSHGRAVLFGVAAFLYFCFFTAWLPSFVLRSSFLATAPKNVADGVIVVIWAGFFGLGVLVLRLAQNRGLI